MKEDEEERGAEGGQCHAHHHGNHAEERLWKPGNNCLCVCDIVNNTLIDYWKGLKKRV